MNEQKKEPIEESWFEEMIRLNSRFPEVSQEKQELPNREYASLNQTDEILKRINPQVALDTLIQEQVVQNEPSKETMDEILRRTNPQTDLDVLIQKQVSQNEPPKEKAKEVSNNKVVLTPYMYTPGYQKLRNYWLCLPTCIQQAIETGGEFIFREIGIPDENLLEEFRKASQTYLDYYFPTFELEVVIKTPEYHGNGNLYKEATGYRLSIQKREKTK